MLKRLLAIAAVTFALTGCAALAQIQNPLDPVDIYRAKNTYAAALVAEIEYRKYCYSVGFNVILADPVMKPVCQYRRKVITAFQKARPIARAALDEAEAFVIANPTISPASAIKAAWDAVTRLRGLIPSLPVGVMKTVG